MFGAKNPSEMPAMFQRILLLLCAAALPLRAGVVESLGGARHEGAVSFEADGAVRVAQGGTNAIILPAGTWRRAVFRDAGLPGFQALGEGWTSQDLGDVSVAGLAGMSNSTLAVRATGLDIGEKTNGFHFASTKLPGDGEMVARVVGFAGAGRNAKAGLMVRELRDSNSKFAMVSVTADGRVAFVHRSEGGAKWVEKPAGVTSLPVWLKLVRKEKNFAAFKSADGKKWEPAGSGDVNLWNPVAYGGLVTASGSNFTAATATFDKVRFTLGGLRGEYFADEDFRERRFTRVDPKLEFWWGDGPPAPGVPMERFSVRWTGHIEPKYSETYKIHLESDDFPLLWIDGKAVPQAPKKDWNRADYALPLKAGQRYEARIDYSHPGGEARMKLMWSSASQKLELVPPARMQAVLEPEASTNRLDAATAAPLARGLLLRSGSFVAGTVLKITDGTVKFAYRGEQEFSVFSHKVARVHLRAPLRTAAAIPAAGTGVVLHNGDFFDGEIRAIEDNAIKLSSVLFGLRTFSRWDTSAIILNDPLPGQGRFEVRTTDGSVFQANAISAEGDAVILDEPLLGKVRVRADTLLEVVRAAGGGAP